MIIIDDTNDQVYDVKTSKFKEIFKSEIEKMGYENEEKNDWLMTRYEDTTERYIEAEQFIIELSKMPWYKMIFSYRKIINFLHTRSKYNF